MITIAITLTDAQAIALLDDWRSLPIRTRALCTAGGRIVLLAAGRTMPALEYPCRAIGSSRLANQTPSETQESILRQSASSKGVT